MYTKPVAIVPSEVEFAPRGWFEGLRITGAAIRTPSLAAKAIPFHVARELVANFSCSLPGHPECHFALCQPSCRRNPVLASRSRYWSYSRLSPCVRRSRMELVQLRATDPVLQHRDAWPPRAP